MQGRDEHLSNENFYENFTTRSEYDNSDTASNVPYHTQPDEEMEEDTSPNEHRITKAVVAPAHYAAPDGQEPIDPGLEQRVHTSYRRAGSSLSNRITTTITDQGPSKGPRTNPAFESQHVYDDPKTPQRRKVHGNPSGTLPPPSPPSSPTPNGAPRYSQPWGQPVGPLISYQQDVNMGNSSNSVNENPTITANSQGPQPSSNTLTSPPFTLTPRQFDTTPEDFRARGIPTANRNPHRDLTPPDYGSLPVDYLTALGGTTRIAERFPAFVCAKERWRKNISPAMLHAVDQDKGRWIACIILDGGTLQRIANVGLEQFLRDRFKGFPNMEAGDVKIMVAEPRCSYLAANNKHAPPRVIFAWIDNVMARNIILNQQTHAISPIHSFHAIPVTFDVPSWYIGNFVPNIKDTAPWDLITILRFAISETLFLDARFRSFVAQATLNNPKSLDERVMDAVKGIDARLYQPDNDNEAVEFPVYIAPITRDYRLSQDIKDYIRFRQSSYNFKEFTFRLSQLHHRNHLGPLFCTLCISDTHARHRCPLAIVNDWQGAKRDDRIGDLLANTGINVTTQWNRAYSLAVPQGSPIPPDGYESDEMISPQNRNPQHYYPPASLRNRTANTYQVIGTPHMNYPRGRGQGRGARRGRGRGRGGRGRGL
ncbi:hypothetical protein E1B28_006499 [Marasmius oreades]|uniref:Uncharacterized protein n=1 Tax=Marasmius oreades TaxID=181124 RepID=A0A9P7S5F9_9AGAR|nr:uncharacterized protein E1B28_006499 [Marasmius oreades]KAG7095799.1 hypothetical protein E1B28_006499 [Marasmius oreades]